MRLLGYNAVIRNFKIVNIHALTITGLVLDLAKLAAENPDRVTYDPERPPIRAVYRFQSSPSTSASIYHTGKVSCCRVCFFRHK